MASGRNIIVLLLGDSWVFWLREYCEKIGIADDLGLRNVKMHWIAQRGMRWQHVVPRLQSMASDFNPHLIIIHCGGNDLGVVRGIPLIRQMKSDLQTIMSIFPESSIAFSQVAERQQWQRSSAFGKKFEKARRNLNKVMSAFMRDFGMFSVKHFNIRSNDCSLFRRDGVHLTDHGNSCFLCNIQSVLRDF